MDTTDSFENQEPNSFLDVISIILNTYINEVPKIHQKLIESIPQQSALFYNNCMFLAHWLAKNAETGIPTQPTFVKTLEATGESVFKAQVLVQQKILAQILKEFGKCIGVVVLGFSSIFSVLLKVNNSQKKGDFGVGYRISSKVKWVFALCLHLIITFLLLITCGYF